MNKYLIVIFDKNHVFVRNTFLKNIVDYPFSYIYLYFVYKISDKGDFVPFCKVEKKIIDMTFTSAFNFSGYING